MPPTAVREFRPEVVLVQRTGGGAWSNLALRIRFEEAAVESDTAATRAWFAARRAKAFRWLIGPSATPTGITRVLLESGAIRDLHEPELTAMVLDHEPPPVIGIRIRPVASFADFEAMEAIREEVFGRPELAARAQLRDRWVAFQAGGTIASLAEIDGVPVSFGVMDRTTAGPMLLAGGVTRPAFRGRGAYRALVSARWRVAAQLGAPALVTQAQAASRPILERLGFRPTGTIEVLVDRP